MDNELPRSVSLLLALVLMSTCKHSRLKIQKCAQVLFGLGLTVGFIGCGSVPSSFKLPSWSISKSDQSSEDTPVEDKNPFELTAQKNAVKKEVAKTPQVQSKSETPQFDSATMMLIETEFRDASPEERRKWYEELRQVPPEMVPNLLRIRRLSQQNDQPTQPKMVAQRAYPTDSEQLPAITERSPGSVNQLEGADPWKYPDPNRIKPGQTLKPGDVITASALPEEKAVIEPAIETKVEPEANPKNLSVDERYQAALDELVFLAEQRAVSNGEEVDAEKLRRQVELRMLYFVADRQERTLEAIPAITSSEQEFWQKMFWGLSNYFDTEAISDPSDRATHTVSQLSEATDRLRERAHLELRNVHFSKGIQGYGSFERFETDEFRPGQPVLVYAEMRNFRSEMTTDGMYRTVLKSTVEVHRGGAHPGLISEQEFPATEDLCQSRRHDYFHSYKINLPNDLTVGPYVLKLIVEDVINQKVATYSVNFMIK